jgi:fibronectin type 3 domain-containing protein
MPLILVAVLLMGIGIPAQQPPTLASRTLSLTVYHTVDLTWTGAAGDVYYRIYRSRISGGPYLQIGSNPMTNFEDLTITAPGNFYYVITALNALGQESAYSNEAKAIVP